MAEQEVKIPPMEVMTARPEGMSYEEYREKRTYLHKKLKQRLKGVLMYLSAELVKDDKGQVIGKRTEKPYTIAEFGVMNNFVIG